MSEGDAKAPTAEHESSHGRIRRLFKNTGIYALGEGGLQLLTAFFTPILTLLMPPALLGVWTLAKQIYTGFMQLCNPALHGAVTRFYFDHEHDVAAKQRFQGTIFAFLLLWSFALCVVATIIGPWLFDLLFDGFPFWPYGVLVVWMAFVGVLGVVPKATWVAAEKSTSWVGVNMLGSAVEQVGSLTMVAFTSLGVLGLFYGRAASLVILAVPFVIYAWRHVKLAWSWADLRGALSFSLPLVPHLLAHWVLSSADIFIIEHHYSELALSGVSPETLAELGSENTAGLGMAAVGIYGAAYVFTNAVIQVASSMNRAWVPQFYRTHGKPEDREFVARSITYLILAVGCVCAALVVLSPTIVRVLFHSNYAFAAEIAPILALGGLFQGLYFVYVAVLFHNKANRLIPVITVVSGLVNVALNLLWLPSYGLTGAAWATVVGYLVLVFGTRMAARRFDMPDFERGRLAKIAVVLIVVALGGVAIEGQLSLWWGLAAKVALLGVGGLSLWRLGVFAPRIPPPSAEDAGSGQDLEDS